MSNDQFFRDTAETGREDVIQAGTFGGLNTTANALNLPWTDSPEMVNVDVSIGGNVQKRKGTRLIGEVETSDIATLDQFRLGSGLSYVVAKARRDLYVFEVSNDVLTEVAYFDEVWTEAAADERPGIVATNENEPRMLFFTGSNAPVQLHAVEVSERMTEAVDDFSIEDAAKRFEGGVPGETLFCYVNATRVDTSLYELEDNTLTYLDPLVAGDVVTFVNLTWQWWAESELYDVNRFYEVATRFQVDESDWTIPIPDTLRDGVELDTYGMYRIYCAWGGLGDRNDSYFQRAIRPNVGLQYMTSTGVIHSPAATWDFPPVGTSHLLFGGYTFKVGVTPEERNDPYTVHMLRIRKLTLNGGRKILPANLLVQGYDFDAPYVIEQAGEEGVDAFSGYMLFDSDNWQDPNSFDPTAQATDPLVRFPIPLEPADGLPGDYIVLDRGDRRGAPLNDLVRFTNIEPKWVGSSATNELNKYALGGLVPAYGLGRYADYGQGLFPNAGAIFSGRLVLGGVVSNSMRLIFSATTDSEFPGDVYQGFTIDAFQPFETSAFDLNLAGSTSEIIEALVEYQNSVFVATSESLYRVFSRTSLNSQTALIQLTGKVGALNSASFSVGAGTLYYLARQGVYTVQPSDGLDDSYTVSDLSIKVRNLIDQPESRCSRRYSMVAYDTETKKLYVSVYTQSGENCAGGRTRLYVLHTERQAWTQYEVMENLRVVAMTNYRDTNSARRFTIGTLAPSNGKLRVIRTEWDWPIDFAQVVSNVETVEVFEKFVDSQNTLPNVQRYVHSINTTGFNDVEDLVVTLDGEVLTFGDDWTKQGSDTIYLRETPTEAAVLTVASRSPENEPSVLQVYRNLFPISQGSGWEQDGTEVTFDTVAANVSHMFGYLFISSFRTPVFSWNVLANYKRAIKWSGLFSNKPNEIRIGREVVGTMPDIDAQQLVGLPVVEVDTNVAIIYNNERQGVSNYDVFRLGELIYDISLYDTYGGPYTADEYVQIVEPLQGTGYSIQVVLWSYDRNTWDFAGYQLVAQPKGRRYSGDNR